MCVSVHVYVYLNLNMSHTAKRITRYKAADLHIYAHQYLHISLYIYTYISLHIYVYQYTCMCVHRFLTYIFLFICTHVLHSYISIRTYVKSIFAHVSHSQEHSAARRQLPVALHIYTWCIFTYISLHPYVYLNSRTCLTQPRAWHGVMSVVVFCVSMALTFGA